MNLTILTILSDSKRRKMTVRDGRPYDAFVIEGRPCLAIYSPAFEKSEQPMFQINDEFLRILAETEATGYSNPEIEYFRKLLRDKYLYVKSRYPSIAPVACLGPSGVGKSSTTNSIFNQAGVAHETSSDSRGTNLVHEYSEPGTYQTSMFEVAAQSRNTTTPLSPISTRPQQPRTRMKRVLKMREQRKTQIWRRGTTLLLISLLCCFVPARTSGLKTQLRLISYPRRMMVTNPK